MSERIKKPITKGITKVPVIMQLEEFECGAASLSMILAYYEKYLPLEKVRIDCDVSKDGSKPTNMLKAAKKYGLDSEVYNYKAESLKTKVTFPCIIFWNNCHFVVLKGFKGRKVYINDPARGSVVIDFDDFADSYSRYVFLFNPNDEFKKEGKRPSKFEKVINRISNYKKLVLLIALMNIISVYFITLRIGTDRLYIDHFLINHKDTILSYIRIVVFVIIFQIIFNMFTALINIRLSGKLTAYDDTKYMWKIFHLPMQFFSQRMAGDLIERKNQNQNISQSIIYTIAPLVLDFITMIFYFIIMLRYNVYLSFIGVLAIALNILLSRVINNKRVNLLRVELKEEGMLVSATMAGIDTIETIKATGSEENFFAKWAGYEALANSQKIEIKKINSIFGEIPGVILTLSQYFITGLGAYLIIKGEFTIGLTLAFSEFLTEFTTPTTKIVNASEELEQVSTQIERIDDVLNYNDDPNSLDRYIECENFDKLSGNIEMKNVTFGYSRLSEPIIKDFSLSIKKGKSIAIVGKSGCGKSTIAKLLSGLYNPLSGSITYDGKTILEIDKNIFNSSISVVNQDITIYEDTVRNNITLWDNSIENYVVYLAASDAKIHDDIMARNGGYSYMISDGGREFSGGQRQRLEIARALAVEPQIIILDEATSALDSKTEAEVVEAIRNRGITIICVAHRLSTIRKCDEIIVLDDGKIVERGTHEDLYSKDGLYRELVINE